jgi:ribosomal protein S25
MRDMALKKRSVKGRKLPHTWKGAGAKGEKHHRALLRETQVRRIRAEYAKGTISQQELADRYEVSRQAVGYIVRGESWRHLTDRGVA